MMKLFPFLIIGCFILYARHALAQNNPYYFSYQVDSILSADSSPYKYQAAAWNYSFIGNHFKALSVKDLQYPHAKPPAGTPEQAAFFKRYHAVDARKAILKEAAKTHMVIINEAHHVALHRAYVTTLLKDLYKQGYTYIGLEALAYTDSLLNQRKYPILSSGFYIQEPSFGNLIREAIAVGFTVFPYEQNYRDTFQQRIGRERSQAYNIKKMMDKHPNDKFIIYCGYDHAVEDTLLNFMGLPMAGQLKNLTGIDPFTIDQTLLTEYFIIGNGYRPLIQSKQSALFVHSAGHYFNRASFPKVIDCNLFHPNTILIHNRPHWLKRSNTKLICLQNKIKIAPPYLIKIYPVSNAIDDAVPVDVIEINSLEDKTASVVLKHTKQIAVVTNTKGQKQSIVIKP